MGPSTPSYGASAPALPAFTRANTRPGTHATNSRVALEPLPFMMQGGEKSLTAVG